MANLVEVIVGTYEEFILGYKVDGSGSKSLVQSFATKSHTGSIRCIAVMNHFVASGGADDRIFIYDMKTRKESQILHHHEGTVNALSFTPDASHLLTGSDDGKMCAVRAGTWQIEGSWKKAHSGSAVTHISCHPSGKLALTLGNDQTLRTWNLIKGRLAYTTNLKTRGELGRNPDCLNWSPDGDHFTITGMRVLEIWSVKTAGVVREFKCESKPVSVCWLNPQDVAVGFEDGKLWILNFKSKSEPVTNVAHKQRVKAINYMNDILATASSSGEITLWTVEEDKTISKITSTNIGCRPTCIALLDLSQFGDDYALKSEPNEVSGEVSDDKNESSSKNRFKPVANVVVEVEEENEEDNDIEKSSGPAQNLKKHKKKSKEQVAQNDGESIEKKNKKKKKQQVAAQETSFETAIPQRKRKSETNERYNEEIVVSKKHKKKKSKRID